MVNLSAMVVGGISNSRDKIGPRQTGSIDTVGLTIRTPGDHLLPNYSPIDKSAGFRDRDECANSVGHGALIENEIRLV